MLRTCFHHVTLLPKEKEKTTNIIQRKENECPWPVVVDWFNKSWTTKIYIFVWRITNAVTFNPLLNLGNR